MQRLSQLFMPEIYKNTDIRVRVDNWALDEINTQLTWSNINAANSSIYYKISKL